MREELISEYLDTKHKKNIDVGQDYGFKIRIGEEDNCPKVWIDFPSTFHSENVHVYIRDLNTNLGVHNEKFTFLSDASYWISVFIHVADLSGIIVNVTDGSNIVATKSVKYDLDNNVYVKGKPIKVYSNKNDVSYYPFKEVFIEEDYNMFGCFVKEGDVCLDLGGNMGFFSLYAISKGASKSYVVEPVDDTYHYLSKNVSCCADIIPIHCGVGGKTGKRAIEVFSNSSGGNTIIDFSQNSGLECEIQSIDVVNINEIIQKYNIDHINFLKFDVEASEYEMFEAFDEDYLTNHVDRMIGEYHNNFNGEVDAIIDKIKRCGFEYRKTIWGEVFGYIVAWKPGEVSSPELEISCNFFKNPVVSISGNPELGKFEVEFIDLKTGDIVHSGEISVGCWISASREWFTQWKILVKKDRKEIYSNVLDLRGKKYYISMDSSSLGDNLAWMPYVEEFRNKHNCKVVLSTFWNSLFEKEYQNIEFVKHGSVVNHVDGQYRIGWYTPLNYNKNPNDFRTIPLQQTASDILGLDYKEIVPKITIPDKPRMIEEKYVCIGIHGTSQCKYWNYINGWQIIVDYLEEKNYKTVMIHKEQGVYMGNYPPHGVIDKSGDRSIEERIVDLKHAKAFIGIGSGLSWLSWAIGTPTILISGFSKPFCEFATGVERLHRDDICNGCFNDPNLEFDKGDWMWCPRDKNFECSMEITPDMVIESINRVIERGRG